MLQVLKKMTFHKMTKEQVKQKLAKIREEFEREGFLTKK